MRRQGASEVWSVKYEKLARDYIGINGVESTATAHRITLFAAWLDRQDIKAAAQLLNEAGYMPPKERLPHVLGKAVHRVPQMDNWTVIAIERVCGERASTKYLLKRADGITEWVKREQWQWGEAPSVHNLPRYPTGPMPWPEATRYQKWDAPPPPPHLTVQVTRTDQPGAYDYMAGARSSGKCSNYACWCWKAGKWPTEPHTYSTCGCPLCR